MGLVLDLGCGRRKRSGAIGVDVDPACGADVVHDLERFPYPFDDAVADEVYLDNVIEHLDDVVATMTEVHRICRPGAMVRVDVPYFRSRWAAIDPTHRHLFTIDSFAYFDPDHPFSTQYGYSPARFRVERRIFNERFSAGGFHGMVARVANRRPGLYESRFSHLYPLDELTFILCAVDPG